MPRLVLISGAPGSGKSTLGSRYVDEHQLTLALDIDVVRAMLGGWLDQPTEAGLLARRLALAMARVQLLSGRDVVVPQFLGRLDFVLELEQLCVMSAHSSWRWRCSATLRMRPGASCAARQLR